MIPVFSIIVPCFNATKTLDRCIRSILSQSFGLFELILVDDGSKDSTYSIIENYAQKDSRIIAVKQSNGGVSSARNKGLQICSGKWVTFVDSDDYIEQDWLDNFTRQVSEEIELASQDIIFEMSDSVSRFCNHEVLPIIFLPEEVLYYWYKNNSVGYVFSKAFKRDIIIENKLEFDTSLNYQEDEEFVLRYLTYAKKCSHICRSSYHYFVPNWDKYYKTARGDLFRKKYESVKQITLKDSSVYSSYLNDYVFNIFKDIYHIRGFRRARMLCRELRLYTDSDIKRSSVFWVTKMLVYYDVTAYISTLFIKLHTFMNRRVYDV